MLCVVTEETERVIGERRLSILREIASGIASTRTPDEVFAAVEACLRMHPHDTPFAFVYLFDPDMRHAQLVASSEAAPIIAPPLLPLVSAAPMWAAAEVARTGQPLLVGSLAAKFDDLPSGPWSQPPHEALVLPIAQQGQTRPAGIFVAGINPHRRLDETSRGFLELLVGQIAAGLANARTSEAERRRAEALAEVDRAKTAFFSNASHEFRTPLTLMLSPLEDLLARAAAGGQVPMGREELALIHRNGLRLLKLVNTLLDFSRIEAGRVQALYEPVDLAAYTAELASTFRSAMDRAGLHFVVDCPPLPAPVHVDRDMWEKIVLNLVSNALQVHPRGRGRCRGAAICRRGHRGADGPGHRHRHRRGGGAAAVRAVPPRGGPARPHAGGHRHRPCPGPGAAKLHGGTVTVESTPESGTVLTVAIPFGTTHLPADRIGSERTLLSTGLRAEAFVEEALRWLPNAEETSEPAFEKELIGPGATDIDRGERAHVLLADDNADMRIYVGRLLAGRYTVEAVDDGQEALEAARRRRPDLVLSDVMMPRLDGFGLVAALRAAPELRDLPIVLLSARAGEEAKLEGLEAGADDYSGQALSNSNRCQSGGPSANTMPST
jgi:signal transduction histidine kinase